MTGDCRCRVVVSLCLALLTGPLAAGEAVRTGLEGMDWQSLDTVHATERALVEALREPLLAARDCSAALQCWLDGRAADAQGDKTAAAAAWEAGRESLAQVHDLPPVAWPTQPESRLKPLRSVEGGALYLVTTFLITWKTDAGLQYGLLLVPRTIPKGHRFPLFLYVHRGRAGLDARELNWLGEQCRRGYAVVAPGLRGQPLADASLPSLSTYHSEGTPDDAAGESSDVLMAMTGAAGLPVVRPDDCFLMGLGAGAAPALLAAARSAIPKAVAVADAGRLDPFRYYYARVSRGENRWPDWAAFCNRPPAEQLAYMAQRSVAHCAGAIRCPVLLLLPEESVGTIDEQAHREVADRLTTAGREARVEVIAGSRRGFTDDLTTPRSQEALRLASRFASRLVPPDDGKDALLTPPQEPPGTPHGN